MHGEPAPVPRSSFDASRTGLEFALRLAAASPPLPVADLLAELATAFGADGAGAAALSGGPPLARCSSGAAPLRWPWDTELEGRTRLRVERAAVALAHPDGVSFLVIAVPGWTNGGWLLWLESRQRNSWTTAENAAFTLAASVAARALDAQAPGGSEQLERLLQQQRLEHAAVAVRRVAHDYGNVLTTILGFNELALTQQIPLHSTLHRYLTEVHGGAECGAELTQRLRLFARRQTASPRPCPLEPILVEEQTRLRTRVGERTKIELSLPPQLPPAAIDGDQLRVIVRELLENAVEASIQPGTVTVVARTVLIAAAECLDYYGNVQGGPHVEVRITDEGDGFEPEVLRRLFAEPFFSTKPRHRGYGLLAAYGVLHAHQGGLRLNNAPNRGAVACVVLPVALVPAPAVAPSIAAARGRSPRQADAPRNESIVSSSR